jgi:hypothetical protein
MSVLVWLERAAIKIVSFSIAKMCFSQNRQLQYGWNVLLSTSLVSPLLKQVVGQYDSFNLAEIWGGEQW